MHIKYIAKSGNIFDESQEVLVFPVVEGTTKAKDNLAVLDKELGGAISEVLTDKDFIGKHQELLVVRPNKPSKIRRLLLMGLGKRNKISIEGIRQAAGKAATHVRDLLIDELTFHLSYFPTMKAISLADLCQSLVESSILALYKFEQFKETKDKKKKEIKKINLWLDSPAACKDMKPVINRGQIIAEATCFARDLTNQPANIVVPKFLANEAKTLAENLGLECHIIDKVEMKKLKMGAILAVAQGSDEPAKLIILQYNKKKTNLQNIALIGKGITFDSGGICIKPDKEMWQMKGDMAGAAVVLATLKVAAQLQLPVRLTGIIPATENMPGGLASRPGDVIKSYAGKTIEIINTDAEGRMVLADALSYSLEYKPNAIIDLATLTGYCVVALGRLAIGLFGNNEALKARIKIAGEKSYERLWEFPLWEEYFEQIESDIADIKNSGGSEGGAITAAAFLKHFVNDIPWAHLDIAGVYWYDKSMPYIPKGATGIGVRLLIELLSNWKKI